MYISASHASRRAASSSTSRRAARGSGANGSSVDLALLVGAPAARDDAVDEERLRDVAVLRDHRLAQLLGQHAAPVGVREQRVVPLRQEADGRGRVGGRERRARDVEQLAAVLVAEAAQRLERVERGGEVGDAEARPVGDVGARRRAEGARGSGARARCARRARPSARARGTGGRRRAAGLVQSADSGACRRCACRRTAWKIRRALESSSWPCASLEVARAPSLCVSGARSASAARAFHRLRARARGASRRTTSACRAAPHQNIG